MKNTETHTCPTVHILGEWIRNFTDPSALNCTFDFQWRGGAVPSRSGLTMVDSEISIPGLVLGFVLVVVFTALPVSIAIFNLRHRHNKFVRATSPRLSLGITVALVLIPPGVLLEGLVYSSHAYDFDGTTIDHICWFDVWLPIFGLTLLYGTLLAKNYRIYRIFYNKKLKIRHDDRLTDGALMLPVLLFLLPVLVLCIGSIATGETRHDESIIPLQTDDSSYRFIRISYCNVANKVTRLLLFAYFHVLFLPVHNTRFPDHETQQSIWT
ncbi:hypothetical protein GBAR_LOCUS19428 [Geodia barretti]|uniref:G-protein coupled receptors family 3 profile domain-containing protein n=1 Tax=Geodia barretti TaxID=519541 RepID=A0AA35X1H2_GEOBA|nr:hypothetical protein GBAR_LOCUS19428 [Geodia barretti]